MIPISEPVTILTAVAASMLLACVAGHRVGSRRRTLRDQQLLRLSWHLTRHAWQKHGADVVAVVAALTVAAGALYRAAVFLRLPA